MRPLLASPAAAAIIAGFVACGSSGGGGSGAGGGGQSDASDGASTSNDSGPRDAASDEPTDGSGDAGGGVAPGPFVLTSTAFIEASFLAPIHTCTNGSNESPPLAWSGAPAGTKSYAVVMRDLTLAPATDNYHWVIYDISESNTSLPQDIEHTPFPTRPQGSKQTYWSFGNDYSYLGPCPPNGVVHDYRFTVYSFDRPLLPTGSTASPKEVDAVIQLLKTGSASLTGKYTRF